MRKTANTMMSLKLRETTRLTFKEFPIHGLSQL